MSGFTDVRRADRLMSDTDAATLLAQGYCGRLASAGANGWPYCVPLLYVWHPDAGPHGAIWVHNTSAHGHLRANIDANPKVCFEVDEPGPVFDYGRFECDSTLAYRSVVAFGTISVISARDQKSAFFDVFLTKYRRGTSERPKGFYPRLDEVTVYAISVERLTGKEIELPDVTEQWPARDQTKTPDAVP
ncbi:MAG: pyridoxamine 5'-phosphate oxidase family protein [Alphaproteobacteria bacterium]|nr:pyridoxamine 5'-phosphate oxidase family protein [Alphaproteobacteria bacterium]